MTTLGAGGEEAGFRHALLHVARYGHEQLLDIQRIFCGLEIAKKVRGKRAQEEVRTASKYLTPNSSASALAFSAGMTCVP